MTIFGSLLARWRGMLSFALIAGVLLAPPTGIAATLQDGDAVVEISGEPGKTSEVRTIRFTGEGAEKVQFVKPDLLRSKPAAARIDRGQVTVTPRAKQDGVAAEYEISVTALPERYGLYEGELLARVGGKDVGRISLKLLVRLGSTQSLTPSPAILVLPMRSGSWPFPDALANTSTRASAPVLLSGLPEGVEVGVVPEVKLMSTRGNGEFKGSFTVVRNKSGNGLLVEADASHASPDKYAATATVPIEGTDRRLAVPIEVAVRISPWCVLGLLAAGIGLGRLAKWMHDTGQKLLAAHDRIEAFAVRVSLIDSLYRVHLDSTMNELRSLLAQRLYAELDAKMTLAAARAEVLERAASLRQLAVEKKDIGARDKLDGIAASAGRVSSTAALVKELDTIEASLTTSGATQDMANAISSANQTAAALKQQSDRAIRRAETLRCVLALAGGVLLALVGYESLYLNGSATFGANFSDLFGALLWGLGSDVAARTITSLGRVAPR